MAELLRRRESMAITKEVLDELLKKYHGPDDLTGEEGLLKQLTKALVERAMGAELSEHLGYEKHEAGEKPSEDRRNGTSPKTVRSDQGSITIDVPRDRDGTFEPKIVGKHQRQDFVDVCAGNDDTGDRRAPEGDLWH
jgi:putative transposase